MIRLIFKSVLMLAIIHIAGTVLYGFFAVPYWGNPEVYRKNHYYSNNKSEFNALVFGSSFTLMGVNPKVLAGRTSG